MSNSTTLNILLVEDNEGDIELIKDLFEADPEPHTIHVASDGETALDFIFKRNGHSDAPDLDVILLDWNLPRISGAEILEQIQQDVRTKTIPVVVRTSSEAERDVAQAYKLRACCFSNKTTNLLPSDLRAMVNLSKKVSDNWMNSVDRLF